MQAVYTVVKAPLSVPLTVTLQPAAGDPGLRPADQRLARRDGVAAGGAAGAEVTVRQLGAGQAYPWKKAALTTFNLLNR